MKTVTITITMALTFEVEMPDDLTDAEQTQFLEDEAAVATTPFWDWAGSEAGRSGLGSWEWQGMIAYDNKTGEEYLSDFDY